MFCAIAIRMRTTPPETIFSKKGSLVQIDCPRCQAPIDVNDLEENAYCKNCGAALAIEMGGAGFALVSSGKEEEDVPIIPEEEQEPDPIHDRVLSDHTKWRVGAVFTALFGLTVLGCAVYSAIREYSEKGMWGLTRGNEAVFLWVIIAISAFMLVGAGIVYLISRSETKKYLKTLEAKKMGAKS